MKAIFVLLFITAAIYGEVENSSLLSSTTASFDGSSLILQGHVLLDHAIGKLGAERATLQKQEQGKEFPFSVIELQKEVSVALKNHATMACDEAHFDFTALKGALICLQDRFVRYQDTYTTQDNKKQSFIITSKSADMTMQRTETADGPQYDIDTITANDQTTFSYGNQFRVTCDQAIYVPKNPQKRTLTANPASEKGVCCFEYYEGKMDAKKFEVNIDSGEILALSPQGYFLPTPSEKLLFQSQNMTWNQNDQVISLDQNVQVQDPMFGTLFAKDKLLLFHNSKKGKKSFHTIQTKGHSTLTFKEQKNQVSHTLTSFGTIKLDRERGNVAAESPSQGGVVPSGKQILYREESMTISSDRANMEYSSAGHTFQPISVTLKGNIRLYTEDQNKPIRCALADRVTYSPSTRTFILAANPGNKVLLWDETETLQIAAQEIHITQDAGSDKESIKGVGNVSFSFSQEENGLLRKHFPNFQLSN